MIELTHDDLLILRNELRELGYDARLVNMGAFDIHQNYYTHYMSQREAQELLRATRQYGLLNIAEYGEWGGLNYWYTFPGKEDSHD